MAEQVTGNEAQGASDPAPNPNPPPDANTGADAGQQRPEAGQADAPFAYADSQAVAQINEIHAKVIGNQAATEDGETPGETPQQADGETPIDESPATANGPHDWFILQ